MSVNKILKLSYFVQLNDAASHEGG